MSSPATPPSSSDCAKDEILSYSLSNRNGSEPANEYGHPVLKFDAAAESKLRLKIDFLVMPLISLIYLLSFIDRSNIGNAKIAGLEKELHLHGYDFSAALSVFFISYALFEIPSNIACKWIGPGWYIPAMTIAFGLTTIGTAYVKDFSSLCGVRFLLGTFEAGMMPSVVYYLSRWYTRAELTFRVSLFIIAASLAGAFGGLLSSAILSLHHFASLEGWRMIFAIEGIVTTCFGLVTLVLLTDRPESAFWLTEDEKVLAVARIKAERIGATEVVDKFSWQKIKLGICNPVVAANSIIFLFDSITVYSLSFFLPTIVRTLYPHKTVNQQQLLTVPPYAIGTVCCLIVCFLSWRLDKRTLLMIICAPFGFIGYAILMGVHETTVRYAVTFIPFIGIFSYGALTNSHVSANVVSDTARSVAIATNVSIGGLGGLISTWIYLPSDAPMYRTGNGVNLAAQFGIFAVSVGMHLWIARDNKKRAKRDADGELRGMTATEIQQLDWKHPGFRWHQ